MTDPPEGGGRGREEGRGGDREDGRGSDRSDPRGHARVFQWTVLALAAAYVGLRFGLPRLAVWLGVSQVPAPVPAFALIVYMLCAMVGALVYVSSDEARWRAFLAPIVRALVLAPGPGRRVRLTVLTLIPLAAGWMVWHRTSPSTDVATAIRLQHPTQPAEYAALENPVPITTDEELREATVSYQKNCRPCHGAALTGEGPLARGLRLRPVDFTDGGTIASVIESYPFWRVREGHRELPPIATPWNSAMPAWGEELTDEEIWRIVGAEYRLSGTEPRRPEGRGEERAEEVGEGGSP